MVTDIETKEQEGVGNGGLMRREGGGVIDELILTAPICISQSQSDGLKLKEVVDSS